ncbi:ATP-binding protein [Streptomyces sp. NPDC001231]|uniref:ATP-binding protein n=1 Tax=Streptomyces sp. NPDC001231 TaxID=3364549 RepID=UPI0036BBA78F
MNGTTQQRPTALRDSSLVREDFPITEHAPGELPAYEDTLRVGAMRRVTHDRLRSRGLDCVADEATLVVSELVTNAILHSGGRHVRLTLDLKDGVLRIRVYDGVPGHRATVQHPTEEDEHGRGLALVQSIASKRLGAWGIDDDGATTWCNLRLEPS